MVEQEQEELVEKAKNAKYSGAVLDLIVFD